MTNLFGLLLLAITSIATPLCTALPDIHKQMSPQQLQSVFHVDSISEVPHYELIQLLHHNTAEPAAIAPNYRSRRSISSVQSISTQALSGGHHVKKDLSKSPYYSELKSAAANAGGGHSANSVHSLGGGTQSNIDLSQLKEHNVSFSAFGKQLNLTLKPTQGLFKGSPHTLRMWSVSSEPNATHGLDLQEMFDENHQSQHEVGEVFQDEHNMAAILMRQHNETGDLIMEGSIGHEMVIKPLPHELSPNKDATHHIVFKRDASSLDHLSDFAFMEPEDLAASENLEKLQRRQRRSATTLDELEVEQEAAEGIDSVDDLVAEASRVHPRIRRQSPYIIYPEVLVIVDYDGYRLHGGDNLQVKRYFISFWNGVDLRYRLLKGPRIRISLAGIIISRGRDATPYLERNRVGRDAIDSAAALTDMGKYLYRERRLPVYDIAVAITKLDMCRRLTAHGECNRGTAGFAYVGGACVVNKRLEKVNSVAIIEDTGGFSGIIVAAHEVGHLLGAVHDGSPPPSYLGGPGAQRCRWEDGYIMSDLRHTERGFRWSPCTVQSFHHFLNGDTATCLHNEPHEDGALGRSLPGSLLSLDAQCRRDRGTYACFKDERVCAQLFCFDAQTGYCVAYRPAAEGSACGNGLHCLDGRCVALPSNNIHNYGQFHHLVYNQADAPKPVHENLENAESTNTNSSEEDTEDTESEDGGNTNAEVGDDVGDNNGSKSSEEEVENVVEQQNPTKVDNSYEETSMEVTDKTEKSTTPSTVLSYTKQGTEHNSTTKTSRFRYLTRLFDDDSQWQQFLGKRTKTTPYTTTTTITTPYTTTQKPLDEDIELLRELKKHGEVVVKTSTSSSVSNSGSGNGNRNTKLKKKNSNKEKEKNLEIEKDITKHIQHKQQQQHQQQNQQQHQQQNQQHTTQFPPTTTSQQEPNLLQIYSNEFRKQLQYYLQLIQKNGSNFLNLINSNNNSQSSTTTTITTSTNNNLQQQQLQTIPDLTKQRLTRMNNFVDNSTKLSNYSVTNNNNRDGNAAYNNPDVNNNNNSNQSNQSEDNVESNEAIEKQKRKFDQQYTPTTTAGIKQQQQQPYSISHKKVQQQEHLITTTTTIANAIPTITTTTTSTTPRNHLYGIRGAAMLSPRSHSYFENYFKKLKTFTTTTTKTTTLPTATTTHDEQQQHHQQQQQHFLKRTLSSSSSSSNLSGSSKNTNKLNHLSSSNNLNNDNPKQQQQEQEQFTDLKTTQHPSLVTNYIGDNSVNLPSVVNAAAASTEIHHNQEHETTSDQQQHQQQQFQADQQQQSEYPTSPKQPHKVKTQKLIRRQLLRTQIK